MSQRSPLLNYNKTLFRFVIGLEFKRKKNIFILDGVLENIQAMRVSPPPVSLLSPVCLEKSRE